MFASGSLLRRRCLPSIGALSLLQGCVRFLTSRDDISQTLRRLRDQRRGPTSLRVDVRPDRTAPPPGFHLLAFVATGRMPARGQGIPIHSEKASK